MRSSVVARLLAIAGTLFAFFWLPSIIYHAMPAYLPAVCAVLFGCMAVLLAVVTRGFKQATIPGVRAIYIVGGLLMVSLVVPAGLAVPMPAHVEGMHGVTVVPDAVAVVQGIDQGGAKVVAFSWSDLNPKNWKKENQAMGLQVGLTVAAAALACGVGIAAAPVTLAASAVIGCGTGIGLTAGLGLGIDQAAKCLATSCKDGHVPQVFIRTAHGDARGAASAGLGLLAPGIANQIPKYATGEKIGAWGVVEMGTDFFAVGRLAGVGAKAAAPSLQWLRVPGEAVGAAAPVGIQRATAAVAGNPAFAGLGRAAAGGAAPAVARVGADVAAPAGVKVAAGAAPAATQAASAAAQSSAKLSTAAARMAGASARVTADAAKAAARFAPRAAKAAAVAPLKALAVPGRAIAKGVRGGDRILSGLHVGFRASKGYGAVGRSWRITAGMAPYALKHPKMVQFLGRPPARWAESQRGMPGRPSDKDETDRDEFCGGNLSVVDLVKMGRKKWIGQEVLLCGVVPNYLECLTNSVYDPKEADPDCQTIIGPHVDAVCSLMKSMCQTVTNEPPPPIHVDDPPSTGPGGPGQGPGKKNPLYKFCMEWLKKKELCQHLLLSGGDPAKQLLELFFMNMRPTIGLSSSPGHTHASGEGSVFYVIATVDRGIIGISCDKGAAADLVKALGHCYTDYYVQGLRVEQHMDGHLAAEPYVWDRLDLIQAGLMNPETGYIALNMTYLVAYGSKADLGIKVTVFYQLIRVDSDGTVTLVPRLGEGPVSEQYYSISKEQRYQVNACKDADDCKNLPAGTASGAARADETSGCKSVKECISKVDDAWGGFGGTNIVLLVIAGLLLVAFIGVYRNGMLWRWTKGGLGKKPKTAIELTRKPSVGDRLKQLVTGKKPKPRLKHEYVEGGVPLILPPNKDLTGPDVSKLKDHVKKERWMK